jgi:hypothetical protein
LIEALRMPRFEHLGANPYTVPGIVPGLLGAIIAMLGLVLLLRAIREGGWRLNVRGAALRGEGVRRLVITLILTFGYAAGLVGLVPFSLATFLFVFLFIVLFAWREARAKGRLLALAFLQALLVAAIVTFVFERIFLVRLP